jgi:hypothetical protein
VHRRPEVHHPTGAARSAPTALSVLRHSVTAHSCPSARAVGCVALSLFRLAFRLPSARASHVLTLTVAQSPAQARRPHRSTFDCRAHRRLRTDHADLRFSLA